MGGFDETFPRLQDVEFHTEALLAKPNYSVFSNEESDCFYRIDDRRIETNQFDFMKRWARGIELYILKFAHLENAKLLRGTYLSYLKIIYFKGSQNLVSQAQIEEIMTRLNSKCVDFLFQDKKSQKRLKRYNRGLQKGRFKIKGYNFFYTRILCD